MMIVDEKYRVNIYLDTNILVDYIEGTYPLLNKSIDYLCSCPFVISVPLKSGQININQTIPEKGKN